MKNAEWVEKDNQWLVRTTRKAKNIFSSKISTPGIINKRKILTGPTKKMKFILSPAREEIFRGRFFINCTGFLHKPKKPKFKNQEKFRGRIFHSAEWEWDFDFSGKKVAVVGSGCSAIQIVPELAKSRDSRILMPKYMVYVHLS